MKYFKISVYILWIVFLSAGIAAYFVSPFYLLMVSTCALLIPMVYIWRQVMVIRSYTEFMFMVKAKEQKLQSAQREAKLLRRKTNERSTKPKTKTKTKKD